MINPLMPGGNKKVGPFFTTRHQRVNKEFNNVALQVVAPLINDCKCMSFGTNCYNNIDKNLV